MGPLDFLADRARRWPNVQLRMNGEVTGMLREDGEHEVRARLTVAADGRNSRLRVDAGLRPRRFGGPMDVLWFRLAKPPDGPGPSFGGLGSITRGACSCG